MSHMSEALRVHREAFLIDSHNDTIVAHMRAGNLGLAVRSDKVQLDLPKMREAFVDAAFFAVDVTLANKNHLTYALDAFGFFEKEITVNKAEITIAKNISDILQVNRDGKIAAILAVENSDVLEGSLRSLAADGVDESRSRGGLTNFGVQLIEEMDRLGMLIDAAHISEQGFWDVLEVSKKPIIVSHGNCKALCNHRRNLTDEQIKGLAEKDGVIGITYVPSFVDVEKPSLKRLLDHIDHVINLVGVDHVGLGSDFDGGGTLLKDATELPKITEGLLERGYSGKEVEKILGENHLRVLKTIHQ